jgi:glucoamylase
LTLSQPWYLAVFAVAEQLFDALYVWTEQQSIVVTPTSLAFFQTFLPNVTAETYHITSPTYITLMAKIALYAEGYLSLNQRYTPSDGSLSEQFDKATGVPTSAVHLTWSYASALTGRYLEPFSFTLKLTMGVSAFGAHSLTLKPSSWGAKGLKVPPGACKPGPPPVTIPVTFNVNATTVFGENIYLVGSVPQLVNWNPSAALVMNCTDTYPIWRLTLDLPIDENIQYKYIRMTPPSTAVTWESDPNNSLYIPVNGTLATNDTWR